MLKWVLIVSAIYLAAVGLALMIVPLKFGIGAVPHDASTELLALMRLLGGPFLGIAVLNWLTRDAAPYLVDRYSERRESAEQLSKRVNQRSQ